MSATSQMVAPRGLEGRAARPQESTAPYPLRGRHHAADVGRTNRRSSRALAHELTRPDAGRRQAMTGAMRIGISARLARRRRPPSAIRSRMEVQLIWPDFAAHPDLFAWLEGRASRSTRDPAPFRLSCWRMVIEDADFANPHLADFIADGWMHPRTAASGRDERGHMQARLESTHRRGHHRQFSPILAPSPHCRRHRRRSCRRCAKAGSRPSTCCSSG